MIYKWKIPGCYSRIDPNDAANELERIRNKHGQLNPELVVEESKSKNAALHKCFEWDDTEAAKAYRKHQANKLICALVIQFERDERPEPLQVRAFVNTEREAYEPIQTVAVNTDRYTILLANARREMESFIKKYKDLTELQTIIAVMEDALK